MKWNQFLLGIGIGFFSGYVTKKVITEKSTVSPTTVLREIKARVRKNGPISGSWILMKPEPYIKNDIQYTVYTGGISQNDAGQQQQFEFIADARTGTILEFSTL